MHDLQFFVSYSYFLSLCPQFMGRYISTYATSQLHRQSRTYPTPPCVTVDYSNKEDFSSISITPIFYVKEEGSHTFSAVGTYPNILRSDKYTKFLGTITPADPIFCFIAHVPPSSLVMASSKHPPQAVVSPYR